MTIVHQESQQRFCTEIDGQQAVLIYRPVDAETLDFRTTFVPAHLRMRGIGAALVRFALAYARENGYRVIPTCWFVAEVIDKNPEFGDLLA